MTSSEGNMISLDHDIPVPHLRSKYPWRSMKVGDSFFVSQPRGDRNSTYWQKTLGIKVVSRVLIENGIKGRRYWRVR